MTLEKTPARRPTTNAKSEGQKERSSREDVTIEKTAARKPAKSEGDPESGADRSSALLSAIRELYQRVGLERNPEKAFQGEEVATFWGARIDGNTGDVRALPSRTLPLISLTLDLVRVGFATRGLLEVIAGCYVSVFSFRRGCFPVWNKFTVRAETCRGARCLQ